VFYGDINRPEVLKNFNVGEARACVFTIDDMTATNKAVISVRKMYPKLPLLVRAKNNQHQKRLENMFDDIYVISPVLAEDSVLLTLPFGGAVLQSLGVSKPEIDAILEDFRKTVIEEDKNFSQESFDFLSSYNKVEKKKREENGVTASTATGNGWKKITNEEEIQEEIKLIIIRNEIEKRAVESQISDVPMVEYSNTDVLNAPTLSSDETMIKEDP